MMKTLQNEQSKCVDKHALSTKVYETRLVPLTNAKMTSLLVIRPTLNFLKMVVIKFDLKSGCIKAKIFFALGAIQK